MGPHKKLQHVKPVLLDLYATHGEITQCDHAMLLTNLPFATSCCEVTAIIKRVRISNNKALFLTVECVMFVHFPLQ